MKKPLPRTHTAIAKPILNCFAFDTLFIAHFKSDQSLSPKLKITLNGKELPRPYLGVTLTTNKDHMVTAVLEDPLGDKNTVEIFSDNERVAAVETTSPRELSYSDLEGFAKADQSRIWRMLFDQAPKTYIRFTDHLKHSVIKALGRPITEFNEAEPGVFVFKTPVSGRFEGHFGPQPVVCLNGGSAPTQGEASGQVSADTLYGAVATKRKSKCKFVSFLVTDQDGNKMPLTLDLAKRERPLKALLPDDQGERAVVLESLTQIVPDIDTDSDATNPIDGELQTRRATGDESQIKTNAAAKPVVLEPELLDLPVLGAVDQLTACPAFDDEYYFNVYPDARAAGIPAGEHWTRYGVKEDLRGQRARVAGYSEWFYLSHNPDIAAAVGQGVLPSGYHHFMTYGHKEGRPWSAPIQAEAEQRILEQKPDLPGILAQLDKVTRKPKISFIVPTYNTDEKALVRCINSVREQVYSNWELCLVDDGSTEQVVHETLLAFARRDARIKVKLSGANKGISNASNEALAMCTGEYVALLDHDDEITIDALAEIVFAINKSPDVDFIYSDEAKIDEQGRKFHASFKPGWSPELLRATMYTCHLAVYRRSIVEAVGGFRSSYDGTQDWDLALRVTERSQNVLHIPKVLYYWRVSPSSTAGNMANKPGMLKVQELALRNWLVRGGQAGTIEPIPGLPGVWNSELTLPAPHPKVSVVIPSAGRYATVGGQSVNLLVNCLESLIKLRAYDNVEYVVIHNGDLPKETVKYLSKIPEVKLVLYKSKGRFNLSEKINLGVEESSGEYVLLLNDDIQVKSARFIHRMVSLARFKGVGAVGAHLLYANGTLQHGGIIWTNEGPTHPLIGEQSCVGGPLNMLKVPHNCIAASGACLLARRDLYLEVGGFAADLPLNYNDVDFCFKVREKGLRIVVDPGSELFHFESQSKTGTSFWELQTFLNRWKQVEDPYFNANFDHGNPFYLLRNPTEDKQPTYYTWIINQINRRRVGTGVEEPIRFSFFLSVYNTAKKYLLELEESIFRQTYKNFELVVVDNGSTLAETKEWLSEIKDRPGVNFIKLPKNLGIMGGYGTAFRAATGDYVVPIDSDDVLYLDCLRTLCDFLVKNDCPDAVYSDEDKMNPQSVLSSPFLKPDWDPVLFTNMCFVAHVCAIRREKAVAIGAYSDDKAHGCHDWDTYLRLIRSSARIMHVPEVLYSWRIHPGSTASISTGTKPYTLVSQKHVLDQHLKLTKLESSFSAVPNTLFHHDGMWRLQPKSVKSNCVICVVFGDTSVEDYLSFVSMSLGASEGKRIKFILLAENKGLASELAGVFPEVENRPEREISVVGAWSDVWQLVRKDSSKNSLVAMQHAACRMLNNDWFFEGAGMLEGLKDSVAIGGQLLNSSNKLVWRGGVFGFAGGIGSPDAGRSVTDSGYHGIGYCQRTVDGVSALQWICKGEFLSKVLDAFGTDANGWEIAGQIAVQAWRLKQRVLYTPFMVSRIESKKVSHLPLLPNCEVPETSNYYHRGMDQRSSRAYQLKG